MARYRKKPIVIEATQWWKNGDHPEEEGNPAALALLDQWYAILDEKSSPYWDGFLREIETHPLQLPTTPDTTARRGRPHAHE